MDWDDIELNRKHAAVGLVILAFLLYFGIQSIENRSVDDPTLNKDVNDYGNIILFSDVDEVEPLGTIDAQYGMEVTWEATIATSDIDAWLYTIQGTNLEKGVHSSDNNVHTFTFTLDGTPTGRTECYIGFGGQYTDEVSWVGSSPHFFVENSATPSFPEPEFVETPEDFTTQLGVSVSMQWQVIYTGPATARFTVDGVTISSRSLVQTTSPQPFTFTTSFSSTGEHKVKMIIEPEYDIAFADEVIVMVEGETNSTSTTTTTTTTTTATTPTTPAEEVGLDLPTIIGAGVLILVIIVIAFLQCRSDRD